MPAGELVVAVEKERLQDQFDPDVAEVTRRVVTARAAFEETARRCEMIDCRVKKDRVR
jgi:hypothetical protein